MLIVCHDFQFYGKTSEKNFFWGSVYGSSTIVVYIASNSVVTVRAKMVGRKWIVTLVIG